MANEQIELASQWFVKYNPMYKNQNIYSTCGQISVGILRPKLILYLFLRIIKQLLMGVSLITHSIRKIVMHLIDIC